MKLFFRAAIACLCVLPAGAVYWVIAQGRSVPVKAARRVLSDGMPAPDFTLTAQDGRTFRLSDYRGRTVFLAFVPSWTDEKTRAEARALAGSQAEFDAVGAKAFLISEDAAETARRFHDDAKLPFPLLIDPENSLARQYTVPNGDYRTTFVVDPSGIVRYRIGDAIIEPARAGKQLIEISQCCVDEVLAARAHGIGKPVGEFGLPRVDREGRMEPLIGREPAKATVVLFLSVKCPCSNNYNRRVRELADRLSGVRVVGVYSNQDETAADIARHARENAFAFPVFRDERALCADHFGAAVTPEAFVLDGQRRLRYAGRIDDSRDPDRVSHPDLARAIDEVMAGRSPAQPDTPAFGCGIVRKENP
ncbi:MAG: redoxin domain-containing protein [Capsulimonadales bacterium]|nr:redoxin domain-containing protein [Capsulimonadales bacterium]